mmetsp:Transcript_24012/g.71812  ORF Transcript_24012/g.71812 Transcript_24012/m.71812 type:complete len:324 (+) Transcript_24012:66-1037(+)
MPNLHSGRRQAAPTTGNGSICKTATALRQALSVSDCQWLLSAFARITCRMPSPMVQELSLGRILPPSGASITVVPFISILRCCSLKSTDVAFMSAFWIQLSLKVISMSSASCSHVTCPIRRPAARMSTPVSEQTTTNFSGSLFRDSDSLFVECVSSGRQSVSRKVPLLWKVSRSLVHPALPTGLPSRFRVLSTEVDVPAGSTASARLSAPASSTALKLRFSSRSLRFLFRPSASNEAPEEVTLLLLRSRHVNTVLVSSTAASPSTPLSEIPFSLRMSSFSARFFIMPPASQLQPLSPSCARDSRRMVMARSILSAPVNFSSCW